MEEKELQTVPLRASLGGFSYSAVAAVYIVLTLVAALIAKAASLTTENDGYLYMSYLVAPVATAGALAFVLRKNRVPIKQVAPVKCHPKYYLIALLLIFGLLFSLSRLNDLALEGLKKLGYNERGAASYLPDLTGGKIVPAFIVIAIIPPVMEEFLFRGVILNACEEEIGSIRTVFIVGACFSLMHGSPEQTVYQFLAGCAFAFLTVRAGSILPAILMHFLNNGLIVIFAACNLFDEAGNLVLTQAADITLIVVASAALVVALALLVFDKKPLKRDCNPHAVKAFFLYAALGLAIYAVLWISALVA